MTGSSNASDPLAHNPVEVCLSFFQKAIPDPNSKNLHTQLGVHFEEIVEMLDTITPLDPTTSVAINAARMELHNLAELLKASDDAIRVDDENRIDFIDSVADQFVTGIGSAYMLGMDPIGAIDEVNDSNLSKFGEDGEPIFDVNMKVQKGPNYRKADLTAFV